LKAAAWKATFFRSLLKAAIEIAPRRLLGIALPISRAYFT
jgi:hypothetical protein